MAILNRYKRTSQARSVTISSLLLFLLLKEYWKKAAPVSEQTHSAAQTHKKKFIFVYKVPDAFTLDLLSKSRFELRPGTKYAQWQSEYFLHQILLEHPSTTNNPEEATIFYVPLYGSGMNDVGPKGRTHIKSSLIHWLKSQKSESSNISFFDRNEGRDHVISLGAGRSWCKASRPTQKTSKCLGFSQNELLDSNMIKLSVEFTGLQIWHFIYRKEQEKLSRIIIVPYMQYDVEKAFHIKFFNGHSQVSSISPGKRKILLAFSGSTLSKTAPFRADFKSECDANIDCLFQNLGNSRQVVKPEEIKQLYRDSTFCAILGGDTRASKRIFDAIKASCIPVIFDPLLALPFAADIPYEEMTISAPFIVSRSVVRKVIQTLREIPESKVCAMQSLLLKYKSYFSYFGEERPNTVDMVLKRLHMYGHALNNEKEEPFQRIYQDWSKMYMNIVKRSEEMLTKSDTKLKKPSIFVPTQKIV